MTHCTYCGANATERKRCDDCEAWIQSRLRLMKELWEWAESSQMEREETKTSLR